jgi:hypothetical protein
MEETPSAPSLTTILAVVAAAIFLVQTAAPRQHKFERYGIDGR